MFIYSIKISIYILLAVSSAFLSAKKLLDFSLAKKAIFLWVAMPFVIFVIKLPVVSFLVVSALLIFFSRNINDYDRMFLFIACLGVCPLWLSYTLNLPGFSGIYIVHYWKVLLLIVFSPLLLKVFKKKNVKYNTIDWFVLLFYLYTSVMCALNFGERGVIEILREVIDNFLYYVFPYFVISRIIGNNFYSYSSAFIYGFFVLAIVLSFVFLMNQVVRIDLYNELKNTGTVYGGFIPPSYRGGFLRTVGPLAAEGLGLVAAAAILGLFFLRKKLLVNNFSLWIYLLIFLVAVLSTGSRGALFSVFVALMCAAFLNSGFFSRVLYIFISLIFVFLYFSFSSDTTLYQDEYGTFEFRRQLYEASFAFLKNNLLFGDLNYVGSGYFDHLRRGATGFIDIVSVYLVVVLSYGLIGLFIYIFPFLFLLLSLFKKILIEGDDFLKSMQILSVAMIFSFLFMISTVSDVGLIGLFGVIFLAFGRSVLSVNNLE